MADAGWAHARFPIPLLTSPLKEEEQVWLTVPVP